MAFYFGLQALVTAGRLQPIVAALRPLLDGATSHAAEEIFVFPFTFGEQDGVAWLRFRWL